MIWDIIDEAFIAKLPFNAKRVNSEMEWQFEFEILYHVTP